jgi:hypothetical protein
LIFITSRIYFEIIIFERISSEKKQKIFSLLKNNFQGLKENHFGFFECKINNHNLLFEFKILRTQQVSNTLKVFLDMSEIEEDIKKLCKIHFYCTHIDNRDWVEMPVDLYFDSLGNLAKHSTKTVNRIIRETESYISEKRKERDKKTSKI